ncbi:MAG: tRNA lysidine(34) synthetase TilS, partial [Thiogranum sp.]|nr:tRNA lysidine(34) synthetase TilS [Thiogranum sp.]
PRQARLGAGWLVRPLLSTERREILDYARRHHLRWVEDPSNTDVRYHRNLLRQRLIPELQQHWPGVTAVLARAADLQADQAEIANALAALDCESCVSIDRRCLSMSRLCALSAARQRNLLRYWIEHNALPLPSRAVLERIREEILSSRPDAVPLVHWPGAEVRRYRDELYLMAPLPAHDPAVRVPIDFSESLTLEIAAGVLSVRKCRGDGLRVPAAARTEVAFRRGGESLQPAGRSHHHTLKHLFQEWGVPEWERDRVPLIYVDGELAAVAGLCVSVEHQARSDQEGYVLHWNRAASPVNNRRWHAG